MKTKKPKDRGIATRVVAFKAETLRRIEIMRQEYPDCTDRKALAKRLGWAHGTLKRYATMVGLAATEESRRIIQERNAAGGIDVMRPDTSGIVNAALRNRSALEVAWRWVGDE